ncbi:ATP-binding protein [Candidatus Woesearchaeota archaeon]|nr:ATP-binding protein [Candidatus Woesearchaeota archaeon]
MEKEIIEAIEETNKWWKEKTTIDFKPREVYTRIKTFFATRQILALTGLRRVGKTTIMLKFAHEYMQTENSTNVFYFSFDDFKDIKIKKTIQTYANFLKKDIANGKYLFLFDEIQKVKGWEEQIKRIYDNYPNIKIIISGSESLFIRKKSRESLAGRIYEFFITPLTFKEYLVFKKIPMNNILLYKKEILSAFQSYLVNNGFPELAEEQNKEIIKKYIKENIIEKIVYKDLPQIVSIEDPTRIEDIYKIILHDPGEIINIERMAQDLNCTRQTTAKYLSYLEKAFLIKKLYNYSKNERKTQRKLKKYYPTILLPELSEKQELKGKIFEASMILNMKIEYFWRDKYKNEVDAIQTTGETLLPIEIKYSETNHKPLNLFIKKFKTKQGIILTYDTTKEKDENSPIKVVPFYEFLLQE